VVDVDEAVLVGDAASPALGGDRRFIQSG